MKTTSENVKHTALPPIEHFHNPLSTGVYVKIVGGPIIAEVREREADISEEEAMARGALICTAVNSHYELVEALRGMMIIADYIDLAQGFRMDSLFPEKFKAARAAIAKAERQGV